DLMGVDVFSALVHRAYAVGVAVGYQSHQRAAFADHARGQFQTPRHRFGQHTAEERIAISANGFNADFAAGEHRFDPTPARPMHRIGDDQRAGVPQVIDLYQALYVAAVIAIRSMRRIRINDVGQPLFLRFVEGQTPRGDRADQILDLVSYSGRGRTPVRSFEFEAVEIGRIV